MLNLPRFSTPATDALCAEIAKKSHGTVFLMCSRGKDSLCAWLQLRKFFHRIIAFHCATVPDYQFANEYLDYLEGAFGTRILRLMGEDLKMALVRHIYQDSPWECDVIDYVFPDEDYTKLDVLDYLRMKFNLPRAWCAVGISQNDSIDRLIYCRKNGGQNKKNRTFYPCYDWPREEMLNAIYEAGLYVAPEYKYTKRSMGGIPSATYNKVMMEHFPRDWELTKKWYPLAEVKNYREDLIDANYPLWMEQEAAKRGGKEEHPDEVAEVGGDGYGDDSEGGEVRSGDGQDMGDGIYIAPQEDETEDSE